MVDGYAGRLCLRGVELFLGGGEIGGSEEQPATTQPTAEIEQRGKVSVTFFCESVAVASHH